MSNIVISNLAWNESVDQQVFQLMNQLGVCNLEISPFRDSAEISEVNNRIGGKTFNLLNHYGIRIVALQSLLFRFPEISIFKDAIARNEIYERLVDVLKFSNKICSSVVVFGSPKNKKRDGMRYKNAFGIAVDFFSGLAKVAEDLNVVFCIEPTPAVYGADFITNTSEAIDLIKAVGRKSFKLNFDVGASILNKERFEGIILDNIEQIGHFHISEPYLKIINQNKFFHNNISELLKKGAYNKFVSIEMKSAPDIDVAKIAEIISFVKNIYDIRYDQ